MEEELYIYVSMLWGAYIVGNCNKVEINARKGAHGVIQRFMLHFGKDVWNPCLRKIYLVRKWVKAVIIENDLTFASYTC